MTLMSNKLKYLMDQVMEGDKILDGLDNRIRLMEKAIEDATLALNEEFPDETDEEVAEINGFFSYMDDLTVEYERLRTDVAAMQGIQAEAHRTLENYLNQMISAEKLEARLRQKAATQNRLKKFPNRKNKTKHNGKQK